MRQIALISTLLASLLVAGGVCGREVGAPSPFMAVHVQLDDQKLDSNDQKVGKSTSHPAMEERLKAGTTAERPV